MNEIDRIYKEDIAKMETNHSATLYKIMPIILSQVVFKKIEKIFEKGLNHETVTALECDQYKTAFLLFIAKEYKRLGWVMQLHYGCKRDNNTTMYNKLGPDTGYDCISNFAPADQLTNMLDAINENGGLPKTILYSLNPGDDELIGTVLGCFQNSDAIGKIQQGGSMTIKQVWKNK